MKVARIKAVAKTSRTDPSAIKLESSDPRLRIIRKLSRQAKHLYNNSNYCQRSWYQLQQAFTKHVAFHIRSYSLTNRDLLLVLNTTYHDLEKAVYISQELTMTQLAFITEPIHKHKAFWPVVMKRMHIKSRHQLTR